MTGKSKAQLPPLDWLRVFESAGRLGGFTAAAREQRLTQAAVSQQMKNLEHWLGRQLFIRSARGVSLTVEGESYLPLVAAALKSLEASTDELFGKPQNELRIAALSSHIRSMILQRIGAFRNAHPAITLVVDSVPMRGDFNAEKTALQLRYGAGNWPERVATRLHREVLAPMASPPHALSREKERPIIEVRGERPGWKEWAKFAAMAPPGRVQLSVDSMAQGLEAASLGLGIVLGSKPLAAAMLQTGALATMELPELAIDNGYWLTWPAAEQRQKHLALYADLAGCLSV